MKKKAYLDTFLEECVERCFDNAKEVNQSKKCLCFYCGEKFDSKEVHEWNEENGPFNAKCPYCGMGTVIPLNENEEFDEALKGQMKHQYFGIDSDKLTDLKYKIFIKNYEIERVTNTSKTEALYTQYLIKLARKNYPEAYYKLGLLYKWGTKYTPKDIEMAISFFSNSTLIDNGAALCEIGEICLHNQCGPVDYKNVYNLFAKGMAVNSVISNIRFLDFYLSHNWVEKDVDFAYKGYSMLWNSLFSEFLTSFGLEGKALPVLAHRLALCYYHGYSVEQDFKKALTFILISEATYKHVYATTGIFPENRHKYGLKQINELKKMIDEKIEVLDTGYDNEIFNNTLFLFNERCEITYEEMQYVKINKYDEKSGTLSFTLSVDEPILYADIFKKKCFCVIGPVEWEFNNVSCVICDEFENEYNSIVYDKSRKCYSFTVVAGNTSIEVLTIYLKE